MNFKIKRSDLIEVFSEFTTILKDNPVKPVISGLKIESKNGQVTFTGTNLDVNYIKTIECETLMEGTVIFKPHLALEYIKLLDDEYISLSSNGDTLSIHLAEFTLLYYDNFPENLKYDVKENISQITGAELYNSIEKVKFSASTSTENLAINCIRILFRNDRISFISTDSYRLTYLRIPASCTSEASVSVPLESILAFCKLVKDVTSPIQVGINEDNLIFQWENSYFSTKLINLPFPNFEAILCGNSFSKEIEFNCGDLKSALKKVLTVARTSYDAKNGAILEFKNRVLNLSAFSGRAKINQKIDIIKTGDDFRCSLNIKYLLEYVEHLNKNIIIKGNSASALFEISEENNEDYKYILMPLALRD